MCQRLEALESPMMRLCLGLICVALVLQGGLGATLLRSEGAPALRDEYIVALKTRAGLHGTTSVLRQVEALNGAKVIKEYRLGDRIFIRISIREEMVRALLDNPYIEIIGQNEIMQNDAVIESFDKVPAVSSQNVKIIRGTLPNEPDCHLDYGGADAWGIIRTSWREKPEDWENTPYVWGDKDSGEGVDAYIVDTGIRTTHEDFEGRAFYGMTGDWSYNSNTTLAKDDINGHGTHIAGTIGGKRFGLARKANLWAVKVLDHNAAGPWSDTIQGLEWIINRINQLKAQGKVPRSVLNMSLSAYGSNPLLEMAIYETMEAGVVFANSAGNVANDTCIRSPSKMGATLTVAATNINDTLAYFSNYGPCTAISAPGRYIMSASASSNTAYRIMSGTSMSTPHVVGIAARYLSQLTDDEAAVTSHERVKAVLSDMSTRGALNYDDLPPSATPDYLLYKTCVNKAFEELEMTTRSASAPQTSPITTTTPATTTTTPRPTITLPSGIMDDVTMRSDDVGPMAIAMLGVFSVIVGSGFGLMGFMHSFVALK